jgi:hypothetical protein
MAVADRRAPLRDDGRVGGPDESEGARSEGGEEHGEEGSVGVGRAIKKQHRAAMGTRRETCVWLADVGRIDGVAAESAKNRRRWPGAKTRSLLVL